MNAGNVPKIERQKLWSFSFWNTALILTDILLNLSYFLIFLEN